MQNYPNIDALTLGEFSLPSPAIVSVTALVTTPSMTGGVSIPKVIAEATESDMVHLLSISQTIVERLYPMVVKRRAFVEYAQLLSVIVPIPAVKSLVATILKSSCCFVFIVGEKRWKKRSSSLRASFPTSCDSSG